MFLGWAKAFKNKTGCYQMFLISFPTYRGKFTPGWKRKSGEQSKIISIFMQVHKLYMKNARHLMFKFRNSQTLKCQSFHTTICLFLIQHLKKIRTHRLNMKPIRICRMYLHPPPHPAQVYNSDYAFKFLRRCAFSLNFSLPIKHRSV